MLPAERRVRTAQDFSRAVRSGARGGRATLVVHLAPAAPDPDPARPSRAGFVVSRAVGAAVVRNRVRRRLRHLVAERLGEVPDGTDLVVRALPPSAEATWTQLGEDLDGALRAARRRAARAARPPAGVAP